MLGFIATIPVTITPDHLDFSQLDVIAGALAGAAVVLVVMFLIGLVLWKAGVVGIGRTVAGDKISDASVCLIENSIRELKEDIQEYIKEHRACKTEQQRCQGSLAGRFPSLHEFERVIDELRSRQVRLREEVLPRDYVRREEIRALITRMDSMDSKLDRLLEREGA